MLLGPYLRSGAATRGPKGTNRVYGLQAGAETWLFGLEGGLRATVFSPDGGLHWRQAHLPANPRAQLLALWPNGELLVGGDRRGPRLAHVDDFKAGPTPAATP